MTRAPGATQAPPRARPRSRVLWVIVFFIGGLIALPAVLGAIFDFGAAAPWLAISTLCLALGGFEIWRADHPAINPRHALLGWIGRVIGGTGVVIALLIGRAYPGLVVAIGVGLCLLLLGLFLVMPRGEPGSRQRDP